LAIKFKRHKELKKLAPPVQDMSGDPIEIMLRETLGGKDGRKDMLRLNSLGGMKIKVNK
jgi:hypothetical protein